MIGTEDFVLSSFRVSDKIGYDNGTGMCRVGLFKINSSIFAWRTLTLSRVTQDTAITCATMSNFKPGEKKLSLPERRTRRL
jgi:hypothetical protein